jgi:hypothetical protein
MLNFFVKEGRLARWFSNLLFFGGLGVMGLAFLFLSGLMFYLVLVTGLLLASISSFEAKAIVLGFKPFTNDPLGWRKAKKSYETKEDSDKEPKKGDPS